MAARRAAWSLAACQCFSFSLIAITKSRAWLPSEALSPVPCHGRDLREQQKRGEEESALVADLEGISDELWIERQRRGSGRTVFCSGQDPMEVERAASIRNVLAPETSQVEVVFMAYEGLQRERESTAGPSPAMTELPVLAGRQPEVGIETSSRKKEIGGDDEIVGREKGCVFMTGVPFGEKVDEQLCRS
jgi:hypothetical protein